MNNNKGNQDLSKQDKNAPKQNQSNSANQNKGREDGQTKSSQGKSENQKGSAKKDR